MNLVEGVIAECNRCRALIKNYEDIGPVGNFGKMMIDNTIKHAEAALGRGDIEELMGCLQALRGCK